MESSDTYGTAMSMHFTTLLPFVYMFLLHLVLTPYLKMVYLEVWWNKLSPTNLTRTLSDEACNIFLKIVNYFTSSCMLTSHSKVDSLRFESCYAKPVETLPPVKSKQSSIWGKVSTRTLQIKNEVEQYLAEDVTVHPDNGGPTVLQYWTVCVQFIHLID